MQSRVKSSQLYTRKTILHARPASSHTWIMDARRSDLIADVLEQEIVTGALDDGARLDETVLAARFGVSRTPIREALHRLASTGFVEQRPRRGVFVAQPGPVELLEMFEVMAEIEGICARLAAERITDTDLAVLTEADRACARAVTEGDTDRYYAENESFHLRLYAASGNGFLEREATRLHRRLKPYRRLQLRLRGRMAQSLDEHRVVLAALRAGDGAAASAALRDHVSVQGEKFHRLIAEMRRAG